eukprot:4147521-Alexandrium_andersonii.AAC.1
MARRCRVRAPAWALRLWWGVSRIGLARPRWRHSTGGRTVFRCHHLPASSRRRQSTPSRRSDTG